MTVLISPPWSESQVDSLNQYQVSGVMHPFTCGSCRDNLGTRFVREDDGSLREALPEDEISFPEGLDGIEILDWLQSQPQFNRLVLNDRLLVATPDGWTCPTCDYTQGWAHEFMLDWSWQRMDWRRMHPASES